MKIDNRNVTKIDDIMIHLSEKHTGDKVKLTVFRDNVIKELEVTLEEAPKPTEDQKMYDYCVDAVNDKSLCDSLLKR